jgi:hypothetical protein
MKTRIRVGTAATLLAAALLLSGCSFLQGRNLPVPTVHSLVGVWKSEAGAALLRLDSSGLFEFTNLPVGVAQGGEINGSGHLLETPVNLAGNWALGDVNGRLKDPENNPLITLTFAHNKWAQTLTLTLVKKDEGLEIEERYGDPDNWQYYDFVRN